MSSLTNKLDASKITLNSVGNMTFNFDGTTSNNKTEIVFKLTDTVILILQLSNTGINYIITQNGGQSWTTIWSK